MEQATPFVRAECEPCDRVFRIPDDQRTYHCKACGGELQRLDESGEHPHPPQSMSTCSECQAMNPDGLTVCVECGASLLTPEEHEDALARRIAANTALRRGYRKLAGVTWLYRIGALAYALVTGAAVLALTSPEVPLGPGLIVVALCCALTILMLVGALQILFRPFAWTVVVASFATVTSAAHLIGPNPLGLAFAWSAIWAVMFWIAVPPALGFQRLIAEHTDLYILHHSSRRTRRAVSGRSGKARHERLLQAMRKANRKAWGLSAAGAALMLTLAGLGSYVVVIAARPLDLGTTVEAFETAWNRGDLDTIDDMFPPAVREQRAARLAGIAEGNGWLRSPPQLANGKHRGEDNSIWVDYEFDGGAASAHWVLLDRAWLLTQVELPIPPLEPALARFERSWSDSDVEAICTFFPEQHRTSMLRSVKQAAELRDWNPFPEISATTRSEGENGVTLVLFTVPSGDVETKWVFRPTGTWGMRGIQFPSRF